MMARNHRLQTEQDYEEALSKQFRIRVFKDGHVIGAGGTIVRYDDSIVVVQYSVSEIDYLERNTCEFFVMKQA